MAFYNNQDDEDQINSQNQSGIVQPTPQASDISGQGAVSSNKVAPTGSVAPSIPASDKPLSPDKPGGFVGIKDYLNANKAQAQKLGEQTSGLVSQSAESARQGVQNLNQVANQQIQGQQALGSDVLTQIGTGAEALTPAQIQQAKATSQAQYKGPQNFTELGESYADALKKSNQAKEKIKQSQTAEGIQGLVSQIGTKPRSQGVNVFDAALLQSGGQRERIAQQAQKNKDIEDLLSNTEKDITTKIGRIDDPNTPDIDESAGAVGQTSKAQKEAYNAIQNALSGWKTGFTGRLQDAQQNTVDLQNRIQQDLGGEDRYALTDETMELLGLTPGQKSYGVDLNQFINQVNPSAINAATLATPEDYARYAALAQLSGDSSGILKQEDIAKAGTAPKLVPDKDAVKAAIEAAKDPYLDNVWKTYQLPAIPESASPDYTKRGSRMTPTQLQADIDRMQSIVTNRQGSSSTNYAAIQSRINGARALLADFLSNIGSGSESTIKKQV